MAVIVLNTSIYAPITIVFDLSRSIDLHLISTQQSNERAVAGVTSGLINLDEAVTWNAKHLFKERSFTSKITAFTPPAYFKDEMQQGDFKSFTHQHFFAALGEETLMTDKVLFKAPFGILGDFADWVYLRGYIRKLLIERNNIIKEYAESGKWRHMLTDDQHGK